MKKIARNKRITFSVLQQERDKPQMSGPVLLGQPTVIREYSIYKGTEVQGQTQSANVKAVPQLTRRKGAGRKRKG